MNFVALLDGYPFIGGLCGICYMGYAYLHDVLNFLLLFVSFFAFSNISYHKVTFVLCYCSHSSALTVTSYVFSPFFYFQHLCIFESTMSIVGRI